MRATVTAGRRDLDGAGAELRVDEHRVGAERERLDHVAAAAESAVHQHRADEIATVDQRHLHLKHGGAGRIGEGV